MFVEGLPGGIGNQYCHFFCGNRRQNTKFLAADSGHKIRAATIPFDNFAKALDDAVSRIVPKCVVHFFEMIDVANDEGQRNLA